MIERFTNRRQAGQLLANRLLQYTGHPDVLVMAVPYGGVEVAYEVSRALDLPMALVPALRFALPGCPDLALGAVGPDGIMVVNEDAVDGFEIPRALVDKEIVMELDELKHLEQSVAEDVAQLHPAGKTVILVDDGLATGTTIRVAIATVQRRGAARIVLAVPAVAAGACFELASHVSEIICLVAPHILDKVRDWYEEFPPVSDGDVQAMVAENHRQHSVVVPTK